MYYIILCYMIGLLAKFMNNAQAILKYFLAKKNLSNQFLSEFIQITLIFLNKVLSWKTFI